MVGSLLLLPPPRRSLQRHLLIPLTTLLTLSSILPTSLLLLLLSLFPPVPPQPPCRRNPILTFLLPLPQGVSSFSSSSSLYPISHPYPISAFDCLILVWGHRYDGFGEGYVREMGENGCRCHQEGRGSRRKRLATL